MPETPGARCGSKWRVWRKYAIRIKMKKRTRLPTRFRRHKIDRLRALLHEAPDAIEKRQNNIHHRTQMLAATQAYNLKLEKTRMESHLASRPNAMQRAAALEHIGELEQRLHKLARAGLS